MSEISRRNFLKQLGAFAATLAFCPKIFASDEKFEMLVIGDSFIWGQGLLEKDKFYLLVKNWLQTKLNKEVSLKVKAHSGATIFLHEKEATLLKNAGKTENQNFPSEVPVSFPTMSKQIENAKSEYESSGKKVEDVNLVMLSGGIVDITVAGVLEPSGKDDQLKKQIVQYCGEDMFRLLDNAANVFPNALFAVVGYFPIISPESNSSEMLNAFLEAQETSKFIKPFLNNILGKQYFKTLKKKAIRRSRIWFEDSNREFENAVNRLNEKFDKKRAVFVKSSLTEKNATHADNTLLFEMNKKNKVNDFFYDERSAGCKEVYGKLRREIQLKESVRRCEIAAIGHPNVEGSKAYAETIISVLDKIY